MFKKIIFGFLITLGWMFAPTAKSWDVPDVPIPPSTSICDMPRSDNPEMYDKYCGSGGSSSSRNSNYDYEAQRRAQAAAEAARQAEEARQAELERQRKAEEERRRQEEIARQAKFIHDRDEAAHSLRGAGGSSLFGSSTPQLRGSSTLKPETGLRDAVNDTGLRGSAPPTSATHDSQAKALQQLQCASAVAGYALSALQESGDYKEFGALAADALKAMDGQRMSVQCPAAPAMPNLKGRPVNIEQLQAKERKILERAGKIADRMKLADDKNPEASKPAPANETNLEKTIRVQRQLNVTNQQLVHNQQDENNRKELTKLILENEKLTSIDFDKSDGAPAPTRRKHAEVPSPEQ